jgi:Holliday junction resolvase-like predicted endonuclease
MNTAAKGYRKEYYIRKQLEKDGWKIVFKSVRFRFGCIDFANLFDVVAYKGALRKFISSKHLGNSNYQLPHQGEIRQFKEEHGKDGESYELWLWDKPRWKGRGKNKVWHQGGFEIIEL